MTVEHLMLGAAVLLLAAIIASKASGRLGVPALIVFLIVGMLAGSDGPGGIQFDHPRAAQFLGIVALALILFAGGLATPWSTVRPVLREGLLLSTFGVAITAVLVAFCSKAVLGLTFREGMLLGAIVSSTDAAAVFGVLRSKNLSLPKRLTSLLEFESGSNDATAVFLTVGMIALISVPNFGLAGFSVMFAQQMAVGSVLGYVMGRLTVAAVNRLELQYDGLYPALTLALALLTYGIAAIAGGNGFLAVYVAAIVLGNSDFLHKRSLIRFHDGLAWLMQIAMFLALGLQVFPSRLPSVMGPSLLIASFLMFVARPVSILLVLLGSSLNWRERVFVSWVGLRGAAPIVLATFPIIAGLTKAGFMFDVVFFIVLTSALMQGTSLGWVAERLKLAGAGVVHIDPLELVSNGEREIVELSIETASQAAGRRVVDLELPPNTLILLVDRAGTHIIPGGRTVLEREDHVLVLTPRNQLSAVRNAITGQNQSTQ